MSPVSQGYTTPTQPEDAQRHRMTPANMATKVMPKSKDISVLNVFIYYIYMQYCQEYSVAKPRPVGPR